MFATIMVALARTVCRVAHHKQQRKYTGEPYYIHPFEVAAIVSAPHDGNRAQRKAIDRAHIEAADGDGQTIKVADLISNTTSISRHDPKFAKIYLAEKALLLQVMLKANRQLLARARHQLTQK